MPARSAAQRRYLFTKFGAAWVRKHHFDNKGKLPEHVDDPISKAIKHRKKRRRK